MVRRLLRLVLMRLMLLMLLVIRVMLMLMLVFRRRRVFARTDGQVVHGVVALPEREPLLGARAHHGFTFQGVHLSFLPGLFAPVVHTKDAVASRRLDRRLPCHAHATEHAPHAAYDVPLVREARVSNRELEMSLHRRNL